MKIEDYPKIGDLVDSKFIMERLLDIVDQTQQVWELKKQLNNYRKGRIDRDRIIDIINSVSYEETEFKK